VDQWLGWEFNKRVGDRRDQASATNTFIKFSIELEKKKLSIIHRIIGKLLENCKSHQPPSEKQRWFLQL